MLAIAKLKGVDASAPIAQILQAVDKEYHSLIDSGQSGKADHVQGLYAWYSKKISQVSVIVLSFNFFLMEIDYSTRSLSEQILLLTTIGVSIKTALSLHLLKSLRSM